VNLVDKVGGDEGTPIVGPKRANKGIDFRLVGGGGGGGGGANSTYVG